MRRCWFKVLVRLVLLLARLLWWLLLLLLRGPGPLPGARTCERRPCCRGAPAPLLERKLDSSEAVETARVNCNVGDCDKRARRGEGQDFGDRILPSILRHTRLGCRSRPSCSLALLRHKCRATPFTSSSGVAASVLGAPGMAAKAAAYRAAPAKNAAREDGFHFLFLFFKNPKWRRMRTLNRLCASVAAVLRRHLMRRCYFSSMPIWCTRE